MRSISIKIPTEDLKIIKKIANKETWSYTNTLSKAVRFFAKAKRIIKE